MKLRPALLLMSIVVPLAATAQQPDASRNWLNPMTTLDRGALKSFVALPLFDPSRRLPDVAPPVLVAAPPPPPPPPEPPPTVHLLGVIQGMRDVAILRQDETRILMLHTGDKLGNWTAEVLPTGLRLRAGERAFDYALFKPGAATGPMAADLGTTVVVPPPPPEMAARNNRLRQRSYR